MTEKTYPYRAWVLQPSFKPVQIEIVAEYSSWGGHTWEQSATKKLYNSKELHESEEAAIAYGWKEVERIQTNLDQRHENLRKKRAALNKAAGMELA